MLLDTLLFIALAILSLSAIGCLYRVLKGPTLPDRVVALDTIGIHLMAITAILSVYLRTSHYLNIILLIGIMGFIGTIAFSKFIERGVVIEQRRDH